MFVSLLRDKNVGTFCIAACIEPPGAHHRNHHQITRRCSQVQECAIVLPDTWSTFFFSPSPIRWTSVGWRLEQWRHSHKYGGESILFCKTHLSIIWCMWRGKNGIPLEQAYTSKMRQSCWLITYTTRQTMCLDNTVLCDCVVYDIWLETYHQYETFSPSSDTCELGRMGSHRRRHRQIKRDKVVD